MLTTNVTVLSGTIQPLTTSLTSAIKKAPIIEPTWLSELGLANDQQADTKHHGGVDRALHLYPVEHYLSWQRSYPERNCFKAGAFGENLSAQGLTETEVCIGDVFQLGDAVIEVSQPRSPCFKLNHRFAIPNMALLLQVNGLAGYLLRVLQPGNITPNTQLSLISRAFPELTVKEVAWRFFNDPLNEAFLQQLVACSALSESWKVKAQQRLETSKVEDWNSRLFGFNLG
ncbi:MOSC domain-containing protein [Motilimonas cestriensis]|uniref:MOSC domain-containing protein n=1 Tax=Motilimonas cestriensis TaxID=2742685 RepID=UPI003DA5AC8F